MKTRNIFAILAALPIMAGMTSCKSDLELTAKPAKEVLIVEGGDIVLRSGDEMKDVSIKANCAWQMTYDQTKWATLSVQPQRGDGDGTLVVMSDQNTTVYDRVDTIQLTTDGGLRQKIAVRQISGDPTMNISARTIEFSANPSGAQLLNINSNKGWTIQTPAGINWMHLDKTSGSSGATAINVSVDQTRTDAARSTSFTIIYGESSAAVQVIQQGMNSDDIFLYASPEQVYFDSEGGEQMVQVESNADWNAYIPSSVEWVHAEREYYHHHDSAMVDNGNLMIYCEPNTGTRDRLTAVVLIAGTKNPQQSIVLIEQKAANAPASQVTVGDITSMSVFNTNAEFRYSFVADEDVTEYGLVYSTTNQQPTRYNAESVVTGQGGTVKHVLASLNNLEPNTTYYVRAFVQGKTQDPVYSPNVVTIKTSSTATEPGESDNPDPSL